MLIFQYQLTRAWIFLYNGKAFVFMAKHYEWAVDTTPDGIRENRWR